MVRRAALHKGGLFCRGKGGDLYRGAVWSYESVFARHGADEVRQADESIITTLTINVGQDSFNSVRVLQQSSLRLTGAVCLPSRRKAM